MGALVYAAILLLVARSAYCYSLGSSICKRSSSCSTHKTTSLRLMPSDDDDRKLTYLEENDKPRINVKEVENINPDGRSKGPTSSTVSSSTSSKPRLSATFGSLSVEDLKSRMVAQPTYDSEKGWKELPSRTEDLNGINPIVAIVSSTFPAGMAIVGWQLSAYLTANFAVQYVTSEIYPVQRLAIVARNLVVGVTTLATGFSAVISLGLFALGVAVAIGVLKGELDPSKNSPIDVNKL